MNELAEGLTMESEAAKGSQVEFSANLGETIHFLHHLGENNAKPWFDAHRGEYENHFLAPAYNLVTSLGPRLRDMAPAVNFEARVNGSIFRINRDVRFSKDKTPYKNHMDLWFWMGERKGWGTPNFFFRLTPETLVLGVGIHRLEKPALQRLREAMVAELPGTELGALLNTITKAGPYEIGGKTRKTVPRGFDPDHPRADLLLHDGLTAALEEPIPAAAFSSGFTDYCMEHYRALWPLNRWLVQHMA